MTLVNDRFKEGRLDIKACFCYEVKLFDIHIFFNNYASYICFSTQSSPWSVYNMQYALVGKQWNDSGKEVEVPIALSDSKEELCMLADLHNLKPLKS